MKNAHLLLILFIAAKPLCAQQSKIQGEVSIFNSLYETKTRQYVSNAQVEEDFGRAQPTISNAAGLFQMVIVGVKEKEYITLSVKKDGLEVVNVEALRAVAGQIELQRIFMAPKGKIAENKLKYYKINREAAEKALTERLQQLDYEILAAQKDQPKLERLQSTYGELQTQFDKIEATARYLAERYARTNLDEVSADHQQAFRCFQRGRLDSALLILKAINLEVSATIIISEQNINTGLSEEYAQRDSEKNKRKQETNEALRFKAQLHQTQFEFDKAEETYRLLLRLDSSNFNNVFEYAYFLAKQNQYDYAIALYDKCLILSRTADQVAGTQYYLGNLYFAKNRMNESENAYKAALTGYRKLEEENPDVFQMDVAQVINKLGTLYKNLYKMKDAEQAYNEALSIQKQLVTNNPGAFLPDLAETLASLSVFYRVNRRMSESEKACNDELGIIRQLVTKSPEIYLPHLARTLNNLGNFYCNMQNMPEAEKAYDEALSARRQLAAKNPEAFLPDLAETLNNLGVFYKLGKRMPEAETACNEALSIYRQLAKKNPDVFLEEVAVALYNFNQFYQTIEKWPEAEKSCNEALILFRQLAEKNPDVFLPNMAKAIAGMGNYYYANRNMPEAEKANKEALSIYRQLAEKNPEIFLPDVANILNRLGVNFAGTQNMPEAEKALTEALNIYRQLVKGKQNAYMSDVAKTLFFLGVFHETLKDYSKALDCHQEALYIYQTEVLAGQTKLVRDYVMVFNNVNSLEDSLEAKKEYDLCTRAGNLLASSCDSLRQINPVFGEISISQYASLSWWAILAKNYALAERAGLRCLALDKSQVYVWTNIGHALWLRGKHLEARTAWLNLRGKTNDEKTYATVLAEDWDALEAAEVVPKGAFNGARAWVSKW